MKIKISVIIPAYNVENFITRTIRSVIEQSLKEIEVIVINDGSTDQTKMEIEKITDVRLKVVNKKNGGVSSARNEGLKLAKGQYLFFLDGDDWLVPDILEKMYLQATQKDADILLSNYIIDNDEGKKIFTRINNMQSLDYLQEFFMGNIYAGQPGKLIKKTLYTQNDIFYPIDSSLGEDLYVNFQLIYSANIISSMEEASLHYIQRKDSITATYDEKVFGIFIVFEKIKSFLIDCNMFERYKLSFEYFEFSHQYYMRLINNKGLNYRLHRKIYRLNKNKKRYFSNQHVQEFIKNKTIYIKIIINCMRFNYFLGIILLSGSKLLLLKKGG